jgi:hypothetical protein
MLLERELFSAWEPMFLGVVLIKKNSYPIFSSFTCLSPCVLVHFTVLVSKNNGGHYLTAIQCASVMMVTQGLPVGQVGRWQQRSK